MIKEIKNNQEISRIKGMDLKSRDQRQGGEEPQCKGPESLRASA